MYNMSLSTLVPTNHVLTSGVNSVMSWSNVLTLSTANCSTVNASSIVTNSIGANVVTLNSTLSVSTLTVRTVNYSSITGSSISTNAMTLSLTNVSTQNTQIYQVATTNPTTSYTVIQASHVSTGTTNNALALNPSGGNVGVGTTTPAAKLDVAGSSYVRLNNSSLLGGFMKTYEVPGVVGGLSLGALSGSTGAELPAIYCTDSSNVGIGTTTPDTGFATAIPNAKLSILTAGGGANVKSRISIGGGASHYAAIEGEHTTGGATMLSFMTCLNAATNSGNPETRMVITNVGAVGIGATTPSAYLHVVAPSAGASIFQCWINTGTQVLAVVTSANTANASWNATDTVLRVSRDTGSGRSINAGGTINANGADYAEYMTKDSDFSALKGDILGVLPSGKLTNQFDAAIHFLLKSTNPCMVGGDVWGTEDIVGEKPKEPAKEATEEEKAAHAAALAAWEARLEEERQKVDRMAFAGQVPVNILGATPGNYIIPLRNADGSIGIAAVAQADMSFSQYQSAVGRVISILADGRANVIVKAV
jgi:hypothetical protein